MTGLRLLALLACGPALAQPAGDAAAGRGLALRVCSACHAVGAGEGTEGPDPTLPFAEGVPLAFEDVARTPGVTEALLHVWLGSSHPMMPDLVLAPREVEDLTAYILSLRPPG